MDTQLETVLVPIAVVLLVLVVAVIIGVRRRPNFRLCGYDKNPDQGPALANNNEPSSSGGDVDVEQTLLDCVPTEESCTPVSDSIHHSMPQENHSAGTQSDASNCSEQEEPDTAVKEVEGSHPVPRHPLYDQNKTSPKSQADKNEYIQEKQETFLNGKDVGCPRAISFVHHEESNTELKESIAIQKTHSFRADHFQISVYHSKTAENLDSCSSIHNHWSSQITPNPVQSALLLPQDQIYSLAMHEKMGVQVQDGAEDIEESSLLAINNIQPQTVPPNMSSFKPPLSLDGRQVLIWETDDTLFSDESIYQSFTGVCAVQCSMEHEENEDFDSLYPAKINSKAHTQLPDLTNILFPQNPTGCLLLSSSQYYQPVVPSKDLTNIPILSLTSMPTLGPGFVEQTDSDSLVNSTYLV
ncbi:hypothetical protein CHS0354_017410 [Potamilus streckersoni]|uniref:Growth hormone receptor n=1 Tax=Potamilus streckersoni TaxID=2493646 RepID=A0AAE0VUG4_9BIVA|nr:hypothetical protein CHS0354_017410 [Potamilus streckersoni]